MTNTKTPGTETNNNEDQNKPSDARIILGPLVKYAAMGLVLVGIIITTAVMLDHQFNDIDRQVAKLEAQLAQANNTTKDEAVDTTVELKPESTPAVEAAAVHQQPATQAVVEVAVADKPASAQIVESTVDTTPAVTQVAAQAVKTQAVISEPTLAESKATVDAVVEDAVAEQANKYADVFDKSIDELIAERNIYLKERDRVYLEEFKASQQKQLQFMRERLARQEKRIAEMEKRHQEIYDIRAANVKEMQEMRENFMADSI